jgi:transposase
MRFVPIKSELAQSRLSVHAVRQGWVEARTACINRLRGLLSEFGVVLPLKAQTVRTQAAAQLEQLPSWMRTAGMDLLDELHRLDERVQQYDAHIKMMAKAEERSERLMQVPGASVPRRPARWWRAWATGTTLPVADSWLRGLVWCRASTELWRQRWPSVEGIGKPWLRSLPRTRAWPGRCWPRERDSNR